jgi:PHD/YefM family antitoxin component YafN of YafNO toxin-antitoxin module
MAGDSSFQSLDLAKVQGELSNLYEQIACKKGRVEIVDGNGSCECVLISRAELEGLEHALEILSDSEQVKELSAHLENLAQLAEPVHAGA